MSTEAYCFLIRFVRLMSCIKVLSSSQTKTKKKINALLFGFSELYSLNNQLIFIHIGIVFQLVLYLFHTSSHHFNLVHRDFS